MPTQEKPARKPNAAFMRPVQPSAKLAKVIGAEPLPRSQVTKKVWDYIKQRGLQDPNKKSMINADELLLPVFDGKRQVSMFDLTKLINANLTKTP
ncbi:MAG TPA: SWIB/MDM2 domain-containing protein [Polyangia bacterium]|jgi:chromatin remodeling complex protein RSC6